MRHALRARLVRGVDAFRALLARETTSGLALLVTAGVALLWANSRWASGYEAVWTHDAGLGVSLRFVVNEGLMTLFFYVVGVEIKYEIHDGSLASVQRAALPLFGALGGMMAPAAIYLLLSVNSTRRGWGVPMATDIAFAVGSLSLLGSRVPTGLRVLLLAIAVIDDVGAILVIAAFYSGSIAPSGLVLAALGLGATYALHRRRVRSVVLLALAAASVWAGLHLAHVHPTLAGVLLGLLTPLGMGTADAGAPPALAPAPASALHDHLGPWVTYAVMPLFALANAGVSLSGLASLMQAGPTSVAPLRVTMGVVLGLVLGKPLGIVLASLLALGVGAARLPAGVNVRGILVVGMIGGVGFTMAIFIASLAFPGAQNPLLLAAKLGILAASVGAALAGVTFGWLLLKRPAPPTIQG